MILESNMALTTLCKSCLIQSKTITNFILVVNRFLNDTFLLYLGGHELYPQRECDDNNDATHW